MIAASTLPHSDTLSRMPAGPSKTFLTRFYSQALQIFGNPFLFSYVNGNIALRGYQLDVARHILRSVLHQQGLTFVVMFPRQSGKNELQAQIEAFLLTALCFSGAEIIKISPTLHPQSEVAMRRLKDTLAAGRITRGLWSKESRSTYRIGKARVSFLSGEPHAHIVGATASTLLEVDEAQDVSISKYDKEIAPMAASTNATRVFWGTAWTSQTLLARELRHARQLEALDGIRRVFHIDGEQVAREVPAYDIFLREQVGRLGRFHPMVRTQFYSEEIDEDSGMFPLARKQLMHGSHNAIQMPQPGRVYAFLLDVGGESASAGRQEDGELDLAGVEHDCTALTVVDVDLATLADDALRAPTYRVVLRKTWQGAGQPELYQQVKALADTWRPRRIIVDATGIGSGLAAFLQKAYPSRVRPFLFTTASKSNLGWDFLSVCDTGRFKDHASDPADRNQRQFWQQVSFCQMETAEGSGHRIRWGVADGTLDLESTQGSGAGTQRSGTGTQSTGTGHRQIHDDLLLSAALCALLDGEKWNRPSISGGFIQAKDPLEGMHGKF